MREEELGPTSRDVIDLDTLIEAIQALSPRGRQELLGWLRSGSFELSPEDSHTLVRIADLLEMLLG